MEVSFIKMQGLGNDFVLLDALCQPLNLTAEQVRRLADRRFGIGCDQVLLIEPAHDAEADIRYRIFNADGREVEQCGNGSRCVARYLQDQGLFNKNEIVAETLGGIIRMYCQDNGQVKVEMGVPRLAPEDIPMLVEHQASSYELEVDGRQLQIYALSMGNPHVIIPVEEVATAPVVPLGSLIAKHPLFPQGVNVGFMQVLDSTHIRLRVYERGVGETWACGTGACAAVVAGRLHRLLDSEVEVELPGGQLSIRWEGGNTTVWMTGPATRVFEGRIKIA